MDRVRHLLPDPGRVAIIRRANDVVRWALPDLPFPGIPSSLWLCQELDRLAPDRLAAIFALVRGFADGDFHPHHDVFGEHACGCVAYRSRRRTSPLEVWFAFQYLALDESGPSPDPADVERTHRRLVLLAAQRTGPQGLIHVPYHAAMR